MRTATVVALMLLLTGGLSASAVANVAQSDEGTAPPTIIFDKDPDPAYWEGERVVMTLGGAYPVEPSHLRVRCLDCPDDHRTYVVELGPEQRMAVFPDSFPSTPTGAPQWNGTWRVTATTGPTNNAVVLASREFTVWLTDIHERDRGTLRPTDEVHIRASGYPRDARVEAAVVQVMPNGQKEVRWTGRGTASGPEGLVTFRWRIPADEAEHLYCPSGNNHAPCRNYELTVRGEAGGKGEETIPLSMEPAEITVEPKHASEAPRRTETIHSLVNLKYNGEVFMPPSRFAAPGFPHGRVDFQLERLISDAPPNPTIIANVTATYDYIHGGFNATWTIPRDLDIGTDGELYVFRWALPRQTDAYGNVLPYTPLDTFRIQRYRLQPTVHAQPEVQERLETHRYEFNFSYADGTPFTAGDNTTRLSGVLEALDSNGNVRPDVPRIRLFLEHDEGAIWYAEHKFPKRYAHLGAWRFQFEGTGVGTQARDRWGNVLVPNATEDFDVTVARPRVEMLTIVDGETRNATRGLERGDRVEVRVKTTYPDGASINQSDLKWPEHQDGLLLRVRQVAEDGVVIRTEEMRLREWRPWQGEWRGHLTIPKTRGDAPIGPWELEVVVEDNVTGDHGQEIERNRNVTAFTRPVHPDVLHVTNVRGRQPVNRISVHAEVSWSFQVRDGDGVAVDDRRAGASLRVDVVQWTGAGAGTTYVRDLPALWNPDRGFWTVTWDPALGTPPGTYTFTPRGSDLQGNLIEPGVYSRPFTVVVDEIARDAIIQPPLVVPRGDEVVVAFDGSPSDMGEDGEGVPRIALERLGADGVRWVEDVRDLRDGNASTAQEHVAVWRTTNTSAVATYRFALHGRDHQHNILTGYSREFSLAPRNVTRATLQAPVPFVEKGATVEALVERRTGDHRPTAWVVAETPTDARLGAVRVTPHEGAWRITWEVPYALETGAYTIRLRSMDAYRNNITAALGPVRVGAVNLTVEPLVPPPTTAARGQPVEFVFRVLYPDHALMESDHGRPRAVVLRNGAPYADANVTYDGVNWHAKWTPGPLMELTSYAFRVEGRDRADNHIPTTDSGAFRLEGGRIERTLVREPAAAVERTRLAPVEVEAGPADAWVAFRLISYGPYHPEAGILPTPIEGQFAGELPHTWDPVSGVYRVEWRPPLDHPLGYYRVVMTGEDAHGNALEAQTGVFQVRATSTSTEVLDHISTIPLGETREYRVRITYRDGTFLTPDDGEPSFTMLLNDQPITPRPEAVFDPDTQVWKAVWTYPDVLPGGVYALRVSGQDDHNNRITGVTGGGAQHTPSRVEQLTGATVPGFDAAALAAALGAALLLARGGLPGRPRRR